MFKLFRKQKSLQIIFETFIVTLPALLNVGGLLVLLVYIFSVLGMNLFAETMYSDPLNPDLNFKTIASASITLLGVATGDGFYELENAVGRARSITF